MPLLPSTVGLDSEKIELHLPMFSEIRVYHYYVMYLLPSSINTCTIAEYGSHNANYLLSNVPIAGLAIGFWLSKSRLYDNNLPLKVQNVLFKMSNTTISTIKLWCHSDKAVLCESWHLIIADKVSFYSSTLLEMAQSRSSAWKQAYGRTI